MASHLIFWFIFNVFVLAMLALDLGIFRRRRTIGFRQALAWTGVWVFLAAGFAVLLYFFGHTIVAGSHRSNSQLTLEFVTGYVIEQSLSIDNLFLFLLIFRFFSVPTELQHKVLFWGVLGALLMRGLFIVAGVALLNRFDWIDYVFGAILVYSGIRLLQQPGMEIHPETNPLLRIFRKFFRVTNDYYGGHFFVKRDALLYATPLALVLLVVETTDVLFAVDSIPAVLAVTLNAFIVYTSNVFAIMGLRSMYFAISRLMRVFRFLHAGLALVLILVGAKMIAADYFAVPTIWMLAVIAFVIGASIAASVVFPESNSENGE